ncbi:MAG TPA: SRPBCC family protein [Candidatus Nanoarchaeia archaeon]|nr:SRPBCC family protein [Candidatus Nanoarchaeia archaeon]
MNLAAGIPSRNAARGRPPARGAQRWATVAGCGALAAYGLSRRSVAGVVIAASGGALALFAAGAKSLQQEPVARASIQVNSSPEKVFQFWRDFQNLPRFMNHLSSVSVMPDGRSRWTAVGPLGSHVSWDAEIVNERENQSISWRSLPGSDVTVDGSVDFRSATGGRGTVVTTIMRYDPPGGPMGAAIAKLLGKDPSFMMRHDLRRMKALLEAGEIPTVEGQPHGRRTLKAAVARVVNPDRPAPRVADIAETISADRRIS